MLVVVIAAVAIVAAGAVAVKTNRKWQRKRRESSKSTNNSSSCSSSGYCRNGGSDIAVIEIKSRNGGGNIERVICSSKSRSSSCNSSSSHGNKSILPVSAGGMRACSNTLTLREKWICKNAVRHGNATWFPDWIYFIRPGKNAYCKATTQQPWLSCTNIKKG